MPYNSDQRSALILAYALDVALEMNTETVMQNRGIIMVLGSPNDKRGNLFIAALTRCEQAITLWRDNRDWSVLLTGGYGKHFNTTPKPHAQYLKEHLIGHGVSAEKILEFAESRNTLEDASLSKPIVESQGAGAVVVITSDYHLDRARFVFSKEFADTPVSLLFIGVPTDEDRCEFDLASQKEHERRALRELRAKHNAEQPIAGQRLKAPFEE